MPVSLAAPWFNRSLLSLALCLWAVLLVLALYGAYLSTSLALPKSEDHKPLLVYGAPFLLKPDLHIGESRLIERLIRLGYHPVSSDIRAPGEYRTSDHAIDIYLHDQPDAHIEASAIRLALEQERVARITLIEQAEDVFPVHLEPQLISGVRGESRQVREWLPLASIPRQVIETVLTVEDRRFYEHHGIDPIAVARAIWANVVKGGLTQGGSTITQQLAKNLFYSPQRTFTRKLRSEPRQVREWLPLASIPRQVIETVLTVEDRRFYEHHGIDPIAVARAIWANVVKGGLTQGGSTITQQLAKNLFYSPQRTFTRKLKESVAALVL